MLQSTSKMGRCAICDEYEYRHNDDDDDDRKKGHKFKRKPISDDYDRNNDGDDGKEDLR